MRPASQIASVAALRYHAAGAELIITSGSESSSRHSETSLHYPGCALDCRTRHLDLDDKGKMELARPISGDLGPDFDVLFEGAGTGNEHIHVEFQPKRRGA